MSSSQAQGRIHVLRRYRADVHFIHSVHLHTSKVPSLGLGPRPMLERKSEEMPTANNEDISQQQAEARSSKRQQQAAASTRKKQAAKQKQQAEGHGVPRGGSSEDTDLVRQSNHKTGNKQQMSAVLKRQ